MHSPKKRSLHFHSVQTSILCVIVPAVVLSMAVLSLMGYLNSREIINNNSNDEMAQCLSVAVESIEKSLSNNRMVSETLARGVEAIHRQAAQDDAGSDWEEAAYQDILTSFVASNPESFGGGIWFEPYAYRAEQQYFSPYCMRQDGVVTYVDNYSLGEGVSYTDQDWYKNAMDTQESTVWSAPYYDEFAQISMVTSSSPIYDEAGSLLGVATADIDLTQMQQMVLSLDVVANGRAFLLDQDGVYIADIDSEKLLSSNILEDENPSFAALGQQILDGTEGTGSYSVDGETYLAWYRQIPESGWYIVTTTAEQELLADADSLGTNLVVLCALFAILLFLILLFYLRSAIIRPLHLLDDAAREIADGNLSVKISKRSKNEFGNVMLSMERTASRLKLYINYIDEISGVLAQMAAGDFTF